MFPIVIAEVQQPMCIEEEWFEENTLCRDVEEPGFAAKMIVDCSLVRVSDLEAMAPGKVIRLQKAGW